MRFLLFLVSLASLSLQTLPVAAAPRFPLPESAIASALLEHGLSIAAGQMQVPAHLTAAVSEPLLEVRGTSLMGDGGWRVRLSCTNAGDCLPFYVTVRSAMGSGGSREAGARPGVMSVTARVRPAAADASSGVTQPAAKKPMLRAGARAVLVMEGERMRVELPVVLMESGSQGSEVRVSSLDHRKTFHGVVVDAGLVRGDLQ